MPPKSTRKSKIARGGKSGAATKSARSPVATKPKSASQQATERAKKGETLRASSSRERSPKQENL